MSTSIKENNDTGEDMTVFVKSLLDQMNERFKNMTENIVKRIDKMSERIDDLEKSVCKLVDDANLVNENENINDYVKEEKIKNEHDDI